MKDIAALAQRWHSENPNAPYPSLSLSRWVGHVLELRDRNDVLLAELGESGYEISHDSVEMGLALIDNFIFRLQCWNCKRQVVSSLAIYKERSSFRCPRCARINILEPLSAAGERLRG